MDMQLRTRILIFLVLLLMTIAGLLIQMQTMPKSAHIVQNQDHVKSRCLRTTSGRELVRLNAVAQAFGSICHERQCHAALESAVETTENRVPKIRHILWKNEQVSAYFASQLSSWVKIHPDWTYVLWRDKDLENFVARYYSGVLAKFRGLKHHIMRVDMIRYLILHHFGGVYADLDYTLVRPLDRFLKYPATVPITAEAIAMVYFGMKWPPDRLGNPAFMISEPQHPFFSFCILQLSANPTQEIFPFAGPLGLSAMVKQYATDFPIATDPTGIVLVPPSRAFDGFANNSFKSSTTIHKGTWIRVLTNECKGIKALSAVQLKEFCKDVYNMDPITNKSELAYAIHDTKKLRTAYDPKGSTHFTDNAVNISTVLPNILMADQLDL